jgi:hypothetical protein
MAVMRKLAKRPRDGYAKFYTISLRRIQEDPSQPKVEDFGLNRSLRITFNTTSLHKERLTGMEG